MALFCTTDLGTLNSFRKASIFETPGGGQSWARKSSTDISQWLLVTASGCAVSGKSSEGWSLFSGGNVVLICG